jgi:Domain of unknown function (DUF4434)
MLTQSRRRAPAVSAVALASALLVAGALGCQGGTSRTKPVRGTFVVLNSWGMHDEYGPAEWRGEFDRMADIGFNTVIVQAVVEEAYEGRPSGAYYRSDAFARLRPHVESILDEADARGWRVFLGLYDRLNAWNYAALVQEQSRVVAAELYASYGSRRSFAGWYLNVEPLLNESSPPANLEFYRDLTAFLKRSFAGKQVAIAPYMIVDAAGAKCEGSQATPQWWRDRTPVEMAHEAAVLVSEIDPDVFILQDALSGTTTPDLFQAYVPGVAEAVRAAGKEFWLDMAVFDLSDACDPYSLVPASIDRVEQQLRMEDGYPIVAYAFRPCMDPTVSAEARSLYEGYRKRYVP